MGTEKHENEESYLLICSTDSNKKLVKKLTTPNSLISISIHRTTTNLTSHTTSSTLTCKMKCDYAGNVTGNLVLLFVWNTGNDCKLTIISHQKKKLRKNWLFFGVIFSDTGCHSSFQTILKHLSFIHRNTRIKTRTMKLKPKLLELFCHSHNRSVRSTSCLHPYIYI